MNRIYDLWFLHYLNGCAACIFAIAVAVVAAAATLMSMNWVLVNVLLLAEFSQRLNFASTSRYCMYVRNLFKFKTKINEWKKK